MSDRLAATLRARGGEVGRTGYLRAGRGESVVLVHGVGMNASIWSPQTAALAAEYDVIAYDMLGHGNSSLPPADACLEDFSDQLLQLLDQLRVDRAHIVGHSMGGLIAIDFAIKHPQRTASVTVLNAVYCRTPAQRAAVMQRAVALEGVGPDVSAQESMLARWFGTPIPASLRAQASYVSNLLRRVHPVGYARAYSVFAASDQAHTGRLSTLAAPAMFITGELDQNSTPEMSRAMAEAAQKGAWAVIPGARHMMAFSNPADVNRAILDFLANSRRAEPRVAVR